jgi:hypothetical protein
MTSVGRNMYAYTSDTEKILKLEIIIKGFKKKYARETAN